MLVRRTSVAAEITFEVWYDRINLFVC